MTNFPDKDSQNIEGSCTKKLMRPHPSYMRLPLAPTITRTKSDIQTYSKPHPILPILAYTLVVSSRSPQRVSQNEDDPRICQFLNRCARNERRPIFPPCVRLHAARPALRHAVVWRRDCAAVCVSRRATRSSSTTRSGPRARRPHRIRSSTLFCGTPYARPPLGALRFEPLVAATVTNDDDAAAAAAAAAGVAATNRSHAKRRRSRRDAFTAPRACSF